ncbi:MAG: hypothetical protein R2706_20015 [Acidimicrobiales bacterium]
MSTTLGFLFLIFSLIFANALCVAIDRLSPPIGVRAEGNGGPAAGAKLAVSLAERLSFHLSGRPARHHHHVARARYRTAGPLMAKVIDPVITRLFGSGATGVSVVLALLIATGPNGIRRAHPQESRHCPPQPNAIAPAPDRSRSTPWLSPGHLSSMASPTQPSGGSVWSQEEPSLPFGPSKRSNTSSGHRASTASLGAEATDLPTRTVRFGG